MKMLPKFICLAVAATLTFASSASADQVITYPEKDPIFSISFPDGWKVEAGDDSVSASSADELVNMQLNSLDAAELDSAIKDAKEGMAEEIKGIQWSEPEKGDVNGLKATVVNGEVTIEGVKMAINCLVFEPEGADNFFMLFNIIPFEALKTHGEAVNKVMQSIKGK